MKAGQPEPAAAQTRPDISLRDSFPVGNIAYMACRILHLCIVYIRNMIEHRVSIWEICCLGVRQHRFYLAASRVFSAFLRLTVGAFGGFIIVK